MDEAASPEVKPITTFLGAWWAFIKLEYSAPRRETDESPRDKAARLSRFRITQNQADAFQIGGLLASIGIPLYLAVAYEEWFTNHNFLIGKFHGNFWGFAAAAVMFTASYMLVAFLMTLVWMVIRKPMPEGTSSETRR